jgi:hypothetical protein
MPSVGQRAWGRGDAASGHYASFILHKMAFGCNSIR